MSRMARSNEPRVSTKAARKHFLSEPRSRQSLLQDRARQRKPVLSPRHPHAERYLLPGGSWRYDFRKVDDAVDRDEPLPKIAGYKPVGRDVAQLPAKVQRAVRGGRQIGAGREGTVWAYGGRAYKVFKPRIRSAQVQRQVRFLQENAGNYVPALYDYSIPEKWIELELLRNYQPLATYVKTERFKRDKRDPSKMRALLKVLARSRASLQPGTSYADLTNLNNVAVRFRGTGVVSDVKFYEGGKPTTNYQDQELVLSFLRSIVQQLALSRDPTAREILRGKIP